MVIRFPNMLGHTRKASERIQDCLRDLCCDDLQKYRKLQKQFYILPNMDIYVDDAMPEEEYGYIFKCLRADWLFQEKAEIIVPHKNDTISDSDGATELYEPINDIPASDEPDIVNFEDYLPPEHYDDGHFEEEMEEIADLDESDDE